MPLWLTASLLGVLWTVAAGIQQTVVPFPPWAFEVSTVAVLLQFVLYALGALLETSSLCFTAASSVSRLLHQLALTVFLVGGIALYGLAGDVLGLASLWALYLLCRLVHRRTEETIEL
jgi:hypothetical protein